jgi:hypothetical protein
MATSVYQVVPLRSALAAPLPIGTQLGLLRLRWLLVSGRRLGSRGRSDPP